MITKFKPPLPKKPPVGGPKLPLPKKGSNFYGD